MFLSGRPGAARKGALFYPVLRAVALPQNIYTPIILSLSL